MVALRVNSEKLSCNSSVDPEMALYNKSGHTETGTAGKMNGQLSEKY